MKKRLSFNVMFVVIAIIGLVIVGSIKFVHQRCQNSFGVEFNATRKQMKIPKLHPEWVVYHKDDGYTIWQAAKTKKGHGFKQIVYDGCELGEEVDDYYFSSKAIQDTILSIEHLYKNSHRKIDSVIFTFREGNREDTISRGQAEYILVANGIDRDY
jgi:hypothetical protein